MAAVLAIATKDLRQRFRDRSAIVVAFVAPIALASIVSLAFGSIGASPFDATWAVADLDGSELSQAFRDEVLGGEGLADQVRVIEVNDAEGARATVARGDASAAFVIPETFAEDVQGGFEATMDVLRAPQGIDAEIAEGVARAFTDQVQAVRLSVNVALGRDPDPDIGRIGELSARAAEERLPIVLTQVSAGDREVTGANYFGPSMAIFFLFFTVGYGARSLLTERQAGTLTRLLASPVPRWRILAGKGMATLVLGLASLATVFVVMGVAFGVHWGDTLALTVLSLVTVLAVMGITVAVATVATTDQQAEAYGSMVAVTFALIGGSFFPLFQLPDVMRTMSLLTPNGWAIRGYTDLSFDGAGLAGISTNLLALGAFALVAWGVAVLRADRLRAA